MTNALLTCTACNDIFRSRHDLNNHVRRDHQSSVKIKFHNGDAVEVEKGEDNTFKCKCGKKFKLPDSLRKHAKSCQGNVTRLEEAEEEAMRLSEEDSDVPEELECDEADDETPIDCYGALISR
jgi:uncharacterized C2H2 Zn-finger protein